MKTSPMSKSTWRRLAGGLFVATAALAAGNVLAHPGGAGPGYAGGMMMGGPMMAGPGGPGGPGAPMMGMRGMMGEHMLDAINATTEQRTQIRQIMDAARADLRSQREAGRGLHDQMRQAFTQPAVDANTVEALRRQLMGQHDAASKRMTQAMLDVSRVLSPEQRAKVADLMAQRRAMMERRGRPQ